MNTTANGSLRKKLIISSLILVIFPVLFLGFLTYGAIENQLVQEYQNQLRREAAVASQNARVVYELAEKKLTSDLKLARQFFQGKGSWRLDKDGDLSLVTGSAVLKLAGNTELVDQVGGLTGGMATIFQLKNFQGASASDELSKSWGAPTALYRISTSVRKADGNRATGTIVSKPVFDALGGGQTFQGRAVVVNNWYMTAYEPIKDETGHLIGALFVGVPEKDFQEVFIQNLAQIRIAETGTFFLMDEKGQFVLSPEGQTDKSDALSRKSASGDAVFARLKDQAAKLTGTETLFQKASWAKPGESADITRLVAASTFAPWNWVIGTQVPARDFQKGLDSIRDLTVVIALVSIVAAMIFVLIFSTRITRPLVEVTKATEIVVQGNFHVNPLTVRGNDETARLARAFNTLLETLAAKARIIDTIASGDLTAPVTLASDQDQLGKSLQTMQNSLETLLTQVKAVVEQINLGADQVSQASQNLSQGSVEQSSALQEIADRAQKIKEQAAANSQNLVKSNKLFVDTKQESLQGRQKMQDLLAVMEGISRSSEETKQIVKAIDDIAFQINLLALNANVEAARAGKYGRGFNVVAEEVRVLANKSGESVKETSRIVETISGGITQGVSATKEMAQKLDRILLGIQESAALVETVTQASKEESETLNRISVALDTAESVTHSNSAGAEQSAAAAEELASQVQELRSMVARFKLREGNGGGGKP